MMREQTEQERILAELIVEALNLEDVRPEEIQPDDPLFGDGLGLDSIDALELALAISNKYSIQITAQDEGVQEVFATLSKLSSYINANAA
jgi:acyl carrier protein